MKEVRYFEQNNIKNPQYAQWELTFGKAEGPKALKGADAADCAIYCIKYVEKYLTTVKRPLGLAKPGDILKFRKHMSAAIYGHSTDAATMPGRVIPFSGI